VEARQVKTVDVSLTRRREGGSHQELCLPEKKNSKGSAELKKVMTEKRREVKGDQDA